MFASAVRLFSHAVCDSAEVLLRPIGAEVWSVKYVNIVKCGKRSYSNNLKKTFSPQVITCRGKSNIRFSNVKYSAVNVGPAISIKNSYEDRSTKLQRFLEKHKIKVSGNNIANPFYSMEDAEFPDSMLSVLRKCNISEPSPIQSMSWPHGLGGRDLIGISKTGSGKTLGYIIPAIIHIKKLKSTKLDKTFPLALVLVPTRELAKQIEAVARQFEDNSFRCVCLCGGESQMEQLRKVQTGIDLCVATPGRILDFIRAGALSLRQCSFLVLDEADLMLDMGFLDSMENIISTIECKKQVLMWSATWHEKVKDVAERFLSDFVMITVGSTKLKPNENIRQIVQVVDIEKKRAKLVELLADIRSNGFNSKILIFVETKFNVDVLHHFLRNKRIPASGIHSGKSQIQRNNILRGFRKGTPPILVATALAARGLDVDDISHVINYDCPNCYDQYIHKIGRTARYEKSGTAITFVTSADTHSKYLLDVLNQSQEEIPKELYSIARTSRISFNLYGAKGKRTSY